MISLPGPIVGAISGRLGGIVAAQAAAGQVIRCAPRRAPAQSPLTPAARSSLARTGAAWENLSDALKLTWSALAQYVNRTDRLGVAHALTARQLYTRYAMLVYAGSPPAALQAPSALTITTPAYVGAYALAGGPVALTTWGSPWPATAPTVIPYTARMLSPLQPTVYRPGLRTPNVTQASPTLDLTAALSALGVSPVAGERLAVGCRWHVTPGLPSAPVYALCTVDDVPVTVTDADESVDLAWAGYTTGIVQSSTYAYSGTYSWRTTSTNPPTVSVKNHSFQGLPAYPLPGCQWELRVRPDANTYLYRHRWGVKTATRNYSALLNIFGTVWQINKETDGGTTTLATVNITPPTANQWCRILIDWRRTGYIRARLYKHDGTLLGDINATDTTYADGGIGITTYALASTTTYAYTDAVKILGAAA